MPHDTSPIQSITEEKRYQDISPLTSDDDSDLEENSLERHARNSTEIAEHDRELLEEDDEREKLLAAESTRVSPGFLGRRPKHDSFQGSDDQKSKRKPYKSRNRRRKLRDGSHDEEGKLMYEMEEGGPKSETSSQASSSSAELNKMGPAYGSMSKVRPAIVTIDN